MRLALPYGRAPLALPPGLEADAVLPPASTPIDLAHALDAALAQPTGSRPLAEVVTARSQVVVVVGGGPPGEARAEAFAAIRRALAAVPDGRITLAVANGPHRPGPLERLGLGADVLARHRVVNHDARDAASTVDLGRTSRGTRIRVNRCLAEADVLVATGRIRPHAVAGYGGGAKSIFPGLAGAEAFAQDPPLDGDPASALGHADGNPFREDLEEAVRRMGRDTFLLNAVEAGGHVLGAVAGDLVYAHRAGVDLARRACEAEAERADVVVVSAPLPATSRLDRAARLLAPAGLLVREGGAIVLAAECAEGVGDRRLLMDRLWPLRIRRYFPERCAVLLVSALPPDEVAETFARPVPDLAAAIAEARRIAGGDRVLVLPDARDVVPIPPR